MGAPREKGRGTYFFWSDWRGSEVAGLTYAAKGLWIDLLAAMADKTPQGVVSGDLESLAEALGYAGPMARAWVSEYRHLVEELEQKGVFSRGRDLDDELEPDAIVNRRMYRERLKVQEVSEARSRAARIRWSGAKEAPAGRVSMDQVRSEIASPACKTYAKLCKGDANGMQSENAEGSGMKGDRDISAMHGDAKSCYTPTQPNPTQPTQPNPKGVQGGEILGVGECIGLLEPLTGKSVYDRLIRFTRDKGERARWWNKVVNVFRIAGQLPALDDHLQYVEGSEGQGIKKPSAYMVSRVLKSARELRLTVPDVPEGGRS